MARSKRMTTTVQLPGAKNMRTLLLAVSSEPHFKQHLYPQWLTRARNELAPEGVATMIAHGINEYLKLFEVEGGARGRMAAALDEMVVEFIQAIIDDPEKGIVAYKFYDSARQKAIAAVSQVAA